MENVVSLTTPQPSSETPPVTAAPTPSVTIADPYVWSATEATPALEAKAKAENPPEPQAKPVLSVPGVPKGLLGDVLTAAVIGGAMVATLIYARRPRHAF